MAELIPDLLFLPWDDTKLHSCLQGKNFEEDEILMVTVSMECKRWMKKVNEPKKRKRKRKMGERADVDAYVSAHSAGPHEATFSRDQTTELKLQAGCSETV
eukprot:TRINITY_DN15432_c0_g1_i1.p2 TRINITY_DN15432_c0_g1~~TRINITY_DN15432_c0_g1_i1.p2  ORF type:complete len:101 (+),score=17.45 TRINITY_DN15432_c0_g1_i1:614-916(+)